MSKFILFKNAIFCILFFTFIQLPISAQVPDYVPQESLAAWYPFEQNGSDVSGNNNHAIMSLVQYTTDAFGNLNSSAYLTGTSTSYMQLNHNEQFNFGEVDVDFSISLWIKAEENENSNDTSILFTKCEGLDNSASFPFRVILINKGDGTSDLLWQRYNPDALSNPSVTTNIPNNEYLHLVFTNYNNIAYIYVNGRFRALLSTSVLNRQNNNEIYFGKRLDDPHTSFKGNIEQLGIWNRAITSCEVYSLFRRRNMLDYPNQIEQQNDGLYFTDANYDGYTFQWYECLEQDSLNFIEGEDESHILLSEGGNYSLEISTPLGYTCVMQSDCFEFNPSLNLPINKAQNQNISIHPNPASEVIIVSLEELTEEKTRAILLNKQGSVLQELAIKNKTIQIDVTNFPNGTYFIQFPEHSVRKSFIINR